MFEGISENLQNIFRKFSGRGHLTEKNIRDGMREVRMALLQADVNFKVVKSFIDRVTEKSVGQDVIKSITPAQQIIKIVQDEMITLMGQSDTGIDFSSSGPTIIMLLGLQGSGKTTTCAKLAKYLTKKSHHPLLVAADIQRPAAVEQLKILGKQLDLPVYSEALGPPPRICAQSLKFAAEKNCDVIILDTAGRLHIDQELMNELKEINQKVKPHHIWLVADAMTGQDAVKSAAEFDTQLPLNGVILTKLDGDSRGGAALSIKAVTGKPIKFAGIGEKVTDFEEFHPDRMASRILGMGDIISLVEKAQTTVDIEEAKKLEKKILKNELNLQDFLNQLKQLKKMGSLKDLMAMIPGIGGAIKNVDEKELKKTEAIILSMTHKERNYPEVIDGRRRQRIARGSGTSVAQINSLLKQFKEMKKMMKNMGKPGKMGGLMSKFMPKM